MTIKNRINIIKKEISVAEKQLTQVVLSDDTEISPFKTQTKSEMIDSLNRRIDAGYRNVGELVIKGKEDNLGVG